MKDLKSVLRSCLNFFQEYYLHCPENTRTWTELENGNFAVTETVSSGADSSTTEELISPTNGNRYVGKTVDGVAEYTATRVVSGNGVGKVATETDRSGATRAYEYDAHGRVIKEIGRAHV